MTDATVVSLCRQYLETWEPAVLMVLADRLEEVGFAGIDVVVLGWHDLPALRRFFEERGRDWHKSNGNMGRLDSTVPAILRLYSGEGGQ